MSVTQDRLVELVGLASLVSLDLVHQVGTRGHGEAFGAFGPPPALHGSVTRNMLAPTEPAQIPALLIRYSFRWDLDPNPAADTAPFATAELAYRVAYSFGDYAPTFQEALAFGESLGVHHTWPYARAKAQVLALELGLPIILLPLHRLPDRAPAEVVVEQ